MSEEPEELDDDEMARAAAVAGITPSEVAALARLTDQINRFGASLISVGAVTTTDYGVAVDLTLYLQTREPPEDAEVDVDADAEVESADEADEPDPIVQDAMGDVGETEGE